MKKTKIVCTMGPSINNKNILIKLLNIGVDVVRLNFSHGNHNIHKEYIKNLNKALLKTKKKVSIILDTKGPEIRTLKLKDSKEVYLNSGQIFCFTSDKNIIGNNIIVGVSYKNFVLDLNIGDIILVDDGLICMSVINKDNYKLICKVKNSGFLGENKSINLPNVYINLPVLSNKDKKDLIFACKNKIDFIAASFVKKSSDILEIRKFLNENNGNNIKIISKIENKEGLKNFDEILNVSDGIMVARGDLGVEISIEDVIFAQKMIIKKCNFFGKIVITATQMLESMILNPRPTRAEAGDVTNAILDGTDAVMTSGESAKGKYPIEVITTMYNICYRTDNDINNKINNNFLYKKKKKTSLDEVICKNAVNISNELNSTLILILAKDNIYVKFIRKYFPKSLILVLTKDDLISRQLILIRGVIPIVVNSINNIYDFYKIGKKLSISKGYAKIGDIIVMVSNLFNNGEISVHTL